MSDQEHRTEDMYADMHNPEKHETSFLSNKSIFIGLAGFVVLILISTGAAALLFQIYPAMSTYKIATPVSALETQPTPPGPLLQEHPENDLLNYKATETAVLTSYGWINQSSGTVHMPVDRAMQLMVQGGIPTFQAASGAAATPAAAGTNVPGAPGSASAGAQLFQSEGCIGCHGNPNTAPPLTGVYQSQVPLQSGGTVTADEAYLRESILSPQAKIVKGYGPIMPSFQGRLTDQQINDLIAYIESLK